MKYCPNCGAEYRSGYERCSDCQVELVDQPPRGPEAALEPDPDLHPMAQDRVEVFRSGRRMDAELVRSRLEADGLEAWIWSGGLGPWRIEAALTEVTGVPNDFNSHRVVVDSNDLERAREVLADTGGPEEEGMEASDEHVPTFLEHLRKRWMLLAFAIFMLLLVIFLGPVGS